MATPTRSGASAASTCIPDELVVALDRVSIGNPTRRVTPDFISDGALVAFRSVSTGSRSRRGTPVSGNGAASARIPDDLLALGRFSSTSRTGGGTPSSGDIPDEVVVELDRASTGSRSRRGTPPSGGDGASSARIPDDLLALSRLSATSRTGGGTPSSGDIPDELVVELDRASTGNRTRGATPASSTLNTAAVAASTTIADLPDHLLQDILRLLPDWSSIFSASFVCHSWRRIITSPANRSSLDDFLGSHPPPLLGFYFELGPPHHLSFAPVAPLDPILSGILERGDFLLDHVPRLQEGEGPNPAGWEVKDSQEGYLLLSWSETGELAVYEPLSMSVAFIETPQFVHHHAPYDLHLAVPMEDPVRVVCVCHMDGSTVEISVCDVSDMLGWRRVGRVETAVPWSRMDTRAVQAGGKLFWPYLDRDKMCQFDVFTCGISWVDVPPHSFDFTVGFTECQQMLLVSVLRSTVSIWEENINNDDGGNIGWNLKTFVLSSVFASLFGSQLETHSDLVVISAHHDFAYLCALQYLESPDAPWVLFSLCMRTGEIQMIIQSDLFAERVHPIHFLA
ncbi:unnamed protein product [Miscanthus lutarioriparius]|uniref:F-box domain-containing protein n=1 Tax=Miscanthus lutarioriparius TaxID=422564 RepID=A0A811RKF4_9POAL|nr:unnamed protein product [Miscanthus lutarioriparius]